MIYALLAVLFWSTVATAFKIALRGLSEGQLLWVASGTATVVLGLALAFGRRPRRVRDFWPSPLLGLLNPFAYYLVLFQAYHRLPAQEALVLNYTWPLVLTVLAALFLRRPFGRRDLAALVLGFLGVAVVATRGRLTSLTFTDPTGTLLALLSAWIWGVYWVLNLRDHRPARVKLFWNFAFGFVYASLAMLAWKQPWPRPAPGLWLPAVYVGLFEMGVTFLVWLQALARTRSVARANTLVYLTPVLSLVWIAWILREPLAPATLVGLALILGGILLEELRKPSAAA